MGVANCTNVCGTKDCSTNPFCNKEKILDASALLKQDDWTHLDYQMIIEIGQRNLMLNQ